MTQEQENLFKEDPLIKVILENNLLNVKLVGGAVLDILNNKKPKDYDFSVFSAEKAKKLGFKYSHDTKTATTYIKDDIIIQVLKTNIEDFDFKISQAIFEIGYNKTMKLEVCEISFNNKLLIPCEKAWKEKKNALNSLRRIPHWKAKGYEISNTTYLSLLSVVGKNNNYIC